MLNGGLKADFYKDKIYLNGKPYPLGFFTVELLNDYYTDKTGARFSVRAGQFILREKIYV